MGFMPATLARWNVMLREEAVAALKRFRPELVALVRRHLTRRQQQAVAAWERVREVKAVAVELGISTSAAQQHLSLAGAIRGRGGFARRQTVRMLREGRSVEEIRPGLRGLNPVTLELAVMELAERLLEERGEGD